MVCLSGQFQSELQQRVSEGSFHSSLFCRNEGRTRMQFYKYETMLLGVLLAMSVRCAAPEADRAVAWIRGGDESYSDTRYFFLGKNTLEIRFDVKPHPGAALELLWGSKRDARSAIVTICGHSLPVSGGGDYSGFRWLRVPLPDAVRGERYEIVLKPGEGKAAFIAEARLTLPSSESGLPDLKQPSYRATWSQRASDSGFSGEAFPYMRKVWDTPSSTAAKGLADAPLAARFLRAEAQSRQANEALYRSRRFIDGWLAKADPESGLIPRNLSESRDYWNGRDSAADNYPFMVLTAAMTDQALFDGRMLEMLRTEMRLTCRVGRLPDDYSFSKKGWRREKVDLDAIIFDSAEYVKDGLLPITEWLGPSLWSERAVGIIDDIWANARIETPFGKIPTLNFEVNGDLLQACSRLFWFTGERKYLDWAIRLGDYYLCGKNHPTRDLIKLSLGDHSCEVINGLSELYVACSVAAPEKREMYRKPLHELYDRLLEIGRNEHGLFYLNVNTRTGEHSHELTDNWGYNYDGLYTAWLLDGTVAYRDAVRVALSNLKAHYTGKGGMCQSSSADGYADSIEGAITLLNREPDASAADWVDTEIRTMWGRQKPDGVIEGWHGDGNSARTSLMYALWKTQGTLVRPWRADVRFGVVFECGTVYLFVAADQDWKGSVVFDKPRHKVNMHLPFDYPRINQFPEWYTVAAEATYEILDVASGKTTVLSGSELIRGVPVSVTAGAAINWAVRLSH